MNLAEYNYIRINGLNWHQLQDFHPIIQLDFHSFIHPIRNGSNFDQSAEETRSLNDFKKENHLHHTYNALSHTR